MPGYSDLTSSGASLTIESNHFRCKCDSVGWLIAAMEHGYQKERLLTEDDRGSWSFLKALYKSADRCVECSLTKCQLSPGDEKFLTFAKSALFSATGEASSLVCAKSGKPVGNGHHKGSKASNINLFTYNNGDNSDGKGDPVKDTSSAGDKSDTDETSSPVAEGATGGAATTHVYAISSLATLLVCWLTML